MQTHDVVSILKALTKSVQLLPNLRSHSIHGTRCKCNSLFISLPSYLRLYNVIIVYFRSKKNMIIWKLEKKVWKITFSCSSTVIMYITKLRAGMRYVRCTHNQTTILTFSIFFWNCTTAECSVVPFQYKHTHTHSQTLWICLHFFAEDCTSIELYVFYRLILSFGSSGILSCVLSLFAKLLRAFRMKQLENCLNWCTSRTNGWEIINNNKQPARVTLDEYMKNTNELKRDIQIHKNDGFYVQTFN